MHPDHRTSWLPRFSVKALLIATALLSAGLWLCLIGYRDAFLSHWMLGFALVGSGLMVPFGRAWKGAVAGFIVIPIVAVLVLLLGLISFGLSPSGHFP